MQESREMEHARLRNENPVTLTQESEKNTRFAFEGPIPLTVTLTAKERLERLERLEVLARNGHRQQGRRIRKLEINDKDQDRQITELFELMPFPDDDNDDDAPIDTYIPSEDLAINFEFDLSVWEGLSVIQQKTWDIFITNYNLLVNTGRVGPESQVQSIGPSISQSFGRFLEDFVFAMPAGVKYSREYILMKGRHQVYVNRMMLYWNQIALTSNPVGRGASRNVSELTVPSSLDELLDLIKQMRWRGLLTDIEIGERFPE